MQKPPIEADFTLENYGDEIFQSEDEMRDSLKRLCHGDMYVIGRLWIVTLRAALLGANLTLIPVIHAAKAEDAVPQKPPPMKYKDLPIYQSPHYEYKDYVEDNKKCPKANVKLVHQFLYPKVKTYRKSWVDSYCELKKDCGELKDEACVALCKQIKDFKRYMRDPQNLMTRQAVVVVGTSAGYFIGSGRGLTRKLFYTSIGALASGALCFPKETDEHFRNISYNLGKLVISFYNNVCRKHFSMRERLPCPDEMPGPPKPRPAAQKNKCDEKK